MTTDGTLPDGDQHPPPPEMYHHAALHVSHRQIEYGISMGSNLGDRLANMQGARDRLKRDPDFHFLAQSRMYDTEPVGVTEACRALMFLNAVVVVTAGIAPFSMLQHLRVIEHDMGRQREDDRNAPRPMDLDILYADNIAASSPDLTLPHPRWQDRRFVVQPLCDVQPDRVLPDDPRRVVDVLCALPSEPKVVLFTEDW